MRERCFTDELNRVREKSGNLGQVMQQNFERPPQLIFGRAGNRDIAELGLGVRAKGGHG